MIDKEKLLARLKHYNSLSAYKGDYSNFISFIEEGDFDVTETKHPDLDSHSYVLNSIKSLNKIIDDLTETVRDEAIKTYEIQHILGRFREAFDYPVAHENKDSTDKKEKEITDTDRLNFIEKNKITFYHVVNEVYYLDWESARFKVCISESPYCNDLRSAIDIMILEERKENSKND